MRWRLCCSRGAALQGGKGFCEVSHVFHGSFQNLIQSQARAILDDHITHLQLEFALQAIRLGAQARHHGSQIRKRLVHLFPAPTLDQRVIRFPQLFTREWSSMRSLAIGGVGNGCRRVTRVAFVDRHFGAFG